MYLPLSILWFNESGLDVALLSGSGEVLLVQLINTRPIMTGMMTRNKILYLITLVLGYKSYDFLS